MWERLYDITFQSREGREKLYFRSQTVKPAEAGISLKKGESVDLGTYFNSFSLEKWARYTDITAVRLRLCLKGRCKITIYGKNAKGTVAIEVVKAEGDFEKVFSVQELRQKELILLGVSLAAEEGPAVLQGGAWTGEFPAEHKVKIGITICTFKREQYVRRNIRILENYLKQNADYKVLVIDNGNTLQEVKAGPIQIVHNRNYGGAGGFTRGMLEYVKEGHVDYVLFMDDDIQLEVSSLDRLYSLLRHLTAEYKEQMIGGAMLRMDQPTVQFENTAYWNRIRMRALGRGFDLTDAITLCRNEMLPEKHNKYAAWWFCCIPLAVIRKNGYPLPVFVKGDDMEYGIRNRRDIITMNGIGVWHEPFAKKANPVVNYFNDRNMLIINHYAEGCNRFTFGLTLFARLARRILEKDWVSVKLFPLAITDHGDGFREITKIGADEKLVRVQNEARLSDRKSLVNAILNSIWLGIRQMVLFPVIHRQYTEFRCCELKDMSFWIKYLKID